MVRQRSIVANAVLSVLTCGIWFFVWMYTLSEDSKSMELSRGINTGMLSGAGTLLLTILTCGIGYIFWCYKLGEAVDALCDETNTKWIYLLLGVFGLGFIAAIMAQDKLNRLA